VVVSQTTGQQLKPNLSQKKIFRLEPEDNQRLANVCGQFNEHLQQIENRLDVVINHRGNQFEVAGTQEANQKVYALLNNLYKEAGRQTLTPQKLQLFLQESGLELLLNENNKEKNTEKVLERLESITLRNKTIKARGENQCQYLQKINTNDINFGIGPAGTGKTYLAVAMAVKALEEDSVRRLILARPAVEAGERLGFLPGDLSQKIDPYLRPLYDALYEMLGFDQVERLIEKNIIEVAPLAFMRGRTLNEAVVLLDEAQNTTKEQMKMFLTRLGFGSKAIITGDLTQTDLPNKHHSGLHQVVNILKDIKGVSFTFFSKKDVVRHPLVQRVVSAYEKHEN
jgi:phosphate starvation-inducible PhoH-like protein